MPRSKSQLEDVKGQIEAKAQYIKTTRKKMKDLGEEVAAAQAELLALMDQANIDSASFGPVGSKVKVTRVAASTVVIDSDKLKKRLGVSMWNKVSVRTLDKKKLEQHIASGDVSARVVAECSTEKESAPYVKVT